MLLGKLACYLGKLHPGHSPLHNRLSPGYMYKLYACTYVCLYFCCLFTSPAPPGYPQDYADLAFHFVERPPEWLICAVCQELALDPVQAICCGKMYCANCIESWKTKSNSCPTCRSTPRSNPPFNVFQDRNAHQRITMQSRCLLPQPA